MMHVFGHSVVWPTYWQTQGCPDLLPNYPLLPCKGYILYLAGLGLVGDCTINHGLSNWFCPLLLVDIVDCHKRISKKAFHKNAKTCRAGFHKKTNQTRWDSHDNTFSDYHPYIDLSNHTHHNSLFVVVVCILVVVNSRIGLWGL